MNATKTTVRRILTCTVAIVAAMQVASAAPEHARVRTFGATGSATMQQVTLPARPARVVQVPGASGSEAWAIALSSARAPGWATDSPAGQTLFMRYSPDHGWVVDGPPVDSFGRSANPTLFDFAMARGGEGWAVGQSGTLVHRLPGGRWVVSSEHPTTEDLHSVSLVSTSGGLSGFAVGDGPTILRLANGVWTTDSAPLVTTNLTAVAASSANTAFAVSGNADQDISIYQRTSSGWSKVSTGQPIVDGPHPVSLGNNLIARRASGASVALAPDGAWIGGVVYVTDATDPFGDDSGRPVMIHVSGGSAKTYCAPAYTFSGQSATEQPLCDEHFPLAQYDVTSIQSFANGEVLAGGQGLFHFTGGAWKREPNTNGYLISLGFSSPSEGWAASTGAIYGAGGSAYSSLITIGHWTVDPSEPSLSRWPQPNREPLESIALSPDGGGNAVAVGSNGAGVVYLAGQAWDTLDFLTNTNLHAVAWPSVSDIWAVGDLGTIAHSDGIHSALDPASSVLTNRALLGVAFGDGRGFAVGLHGTILRYANGHWTVDPQSERLTTRNLQAIASTPGGFVATGEKGTAIEFTDGSWHALSLGYAGSRAPDLGTAVRLVDGTVVIGGSQGALLWRAPGEAAFHPVGSPVDATIVAAGGSRDALFVSVSQADTKWSGPRLSAPASTFLVRTDNVWRDIQHAGVRTASLVNDPSAPSDGLYAIATDASGSTGWVVGGTLVNTEDDDQHVFGEPTSAIYRFSLTHDTSPPDDTVLPALPQGDSFAFFSETACSKGMCEAAIGSGQRADLIPQLIQREIDTVAGLPNGPQFVMFGGNMRASGHPEELAEFKTFLRNFGNLPVYGAMGDKDLFSGPATQTSGTVSSFTPSNSAYLSEFAGMPAPWGTGSAPSGIAPVAFTTQPTAGLSRTHYAFDVLGRDGKPSYRVVVLDSSRHKLDGTGQNPPNENQLDTYLPAVLSQANLAGIPSIIVLNQPTLNPYFLGSQQANYTPATDGTQLESVAAANGAKAVFAGGFPINASYTPADTQTPTSPNGVPFYISGGGGRQFELTKRPTDGFFPAWMLVTVAKVDGRPTVQVSTFPVVDSIGLHSVTGGYVHAGNASRFRALARFPLGGFSDLEQTRASYVEVPFVGRCANAGLYAGVCTNKNALIPSYRFSTSDSSQAQFVKWDPGRDAPFRDLSGNLVPDDQSGYLCTFKTGWVDVYITMGLHRAVRPLYVDGGFGPCVDKPVPYPPQIVPKVAPKPVHRPVPAKQFFFRPPPQPQTAIVFPPIPAPVVAPAPPGAPGVGRKEEHEVEFETESHNDGHSFVALEHRRADPVPAPWLMLTGMFAFALGLAAVAASRKEKRHQYAKSWVSRS